MGDFDVGWERYVSHGGVLGLQLVNNHSCSCHVFSSGKSLSLSLLLYCVFVYVIV
jgi:hypothetical protein